MARGRSAALSLLIVCLLCRAPAAHAYPVKQVNLVVGFASGGYTDSWARLLALGMGQSLRQQVTVTNVPGAGGAIALAGAAAAQPDGHAIYATGTHVVINSVLGRIPFGIWDMTHIAVTDLEPLLLVTSSDSPWQNVKEFLTWSEESTESVTMAHPGAGGLNHLCGQAFLHAIGSSSNLQGFDGEWNASKAIKTGQAHMGFISYSTFSAQEGLRALAVTSPLRLLKLAAVPTLLESGIKGVPKGYWRGLGGPGGLPQSVVNTIARALGQAVKGRDYLAFLDNQGCLAMYLTGDAMRDFIEDDRRVIERVLAGSRL